MLMFFCYILECADHSFYVRVTDDLARRLKDHKDGRAANEPERGRVRE